MSTDKMKYLEVEVETGMRGVYSTKKKSVKIVFTEQDTEEEVLPQEDLFVFDERLLPAPARRGLPMANFVWNIGKKKHSTDPLKEMGSFFTKLDEGTYVVSIKKEYWQAMRDSITRMKFKLERIKEISVLNLLVLIEKAFNSFAIYQAEESA